MRDILSERRIPHPTIPGRVYIVRHVADPDSRPNEDETPAERYRGLPADEIARYARADARRVASWKRDRWSYLGICVEVRQQTASGWADGGLLIGRASVWGVESDSGRKYLEAVATEMMDEADHEVVRLQRAIEKGYPAS